MLLLPLSGWLHDSAWKDAATHPPQVFGIVPWSRIRWIERVARRKLLQIHAATELASLRIPPGNQLEALKSDRKGQHSIRIDDQRRICFLWKADGAYRVEIVDYH